jgi:Na+-transporting NADH:ubiquinone oxidoreductase subunit A
LIRVRRGLDLPIQGKPEQRIEDGAAVRHVALVGDDYVGMKPTMAVNEGDSVALGQLLFEDKTTPGVRYTSPGAGKVVAVNRGAKRKFESVVIRLEGSDEKTFSSASDLGALTRSKVRETLVESGLWTAFRTRPFSRVPAPDAAPHSIFVTALDTRPLAGDPTVVLQGNEDDFERGLALLPHLTDGTVWLCRRPGAPIPTGQVERVEVEEFAGPHPAGLPGTHIHMLEPVSEKRTAWSVDYQDVLAMGRLFRTGRLSVERVVALGGPVVRRPRLLRTRLGASVEELVAHEGGADQPRWIAGSVLHGRTAEGPHAYLGRYHLQISGLGVQPTRPFLGWLGPGFSTYSRLPIFASAVVPGKRFAFNTDAHGDPRAIVPIGVFEKVMPLDLVPTALLKSLMVGDAERAQELGCLELDEEDLALCAFVDPGKGDFGAALRRVLTNIEKEG